MLQMFLCYAKDVLITEWLLNLSLNQDCNDAQNYAVPLHDARRQYIALFSCCLKKKFSWMVYTLNQLIISYCHTLSISEKIIRKICYDDFLTIQVLGNLFISYIFVYFLNILDIILTWLFLILWHLSRSVLTTLIVMTSSWLYKIH